MKTRHPPALASWLLDRLGYTALNPALAGDMLEEFRNGRSPAWYWRQTLRVIAIGAGRNAFNLQRRLMACFIGFAAQAPVAYYLWRLHAPAMIRGWAWMILAPLLILNMAVKLLTIINLSTDGKKYLRSLLLATAGGPQRRQTNLALAGFEAFAGYLLVYCISALWYRPGLSVREFANCEGIWLVLSLLWLTPALIRAHSPTSPSLQPRAGVR